MGQNAVDATGCIYTADSDGLYPQHLVSPRSWLLVFEHIMDRSAKLAGTLATVDTV